jgi:hypothetical protein
MVWAIITRDKRMAGRPRRKALIRDHGVRMFAIANTESLDNWALLEIVMTRWRDIERESAKPGPFVFLMTRTAFRRLELD